LKNPYKDAAKPIRIDILKKLPSLFPAEYFGSNLKPILAHIKKPHNEKSAPPNRRAKLKML
jgi:hypothetical protein